MHHQPWYRKHAPSTLEEIALPNCWYKRFGDFAIRKYLPNLMFFGQPGSGKTTLAELLQQLCAPGREGMERYDSQRKPCLKDIEQGLRHGRNLIAQGTVVVTIDDAPEAITPAAKPSLINLMDRYGEQVRFIFTANDAAKLGRPLQSRCECYDFSHIGEREVMTALKRISLRERLDIADAELAAICAQAGGDVRQSIQRLEFLAGSLTPRT